MFLIFSTRVRFPSPASYLFGGTHASKALKPITKPITSPGNSRDFSCCLCGKKQALAIARQSSPRLVSQACCYLRSTIAGKAIVRESANSKPFAYINLPTNTGPGAMFKALMNPKLKGRLDLDTLDDLTCTLWAFANRQHDLTRSTRNP
jgi:hypothetical protein